MKNAFRRLRGICLMLVLLTGLLTAMGSGVPAHASSVHYLTPYQVHHLDIYSGDINKSFSMMGKSYIYGVCPSNYSSNKFAEYFLDQEFSTVTFEYGVSKTYNYNPSGRLRVYRDGTLGETYELTPQMVTQTKTIPTRDTTVLSFEFYTPSGSLFYGLGNVTGDGGHVWDYDSQIMSKSPTREAEGEYSYTCSCCGATKTVTIPSQAVCRPDLVPYSCYNLEYKHEFDNADGKADPSKKRVMGRSWKTGIFCGNYTKNRTALFNLNYNYTTVSFMVGHEDGAYRNPATLNIYKNGELQPFRTLKLSGNMTSQKIVINAAAIGQLKLEIVSDSSSDVFYCFYDFQYDWITGKPHDFELTSEIEATTYSNGSEVYTCKDCHYVETVVIPRITEPTVTQTPDSPTITPAAEENKEQNQEETDPVVTVPRVKKVTCKAGKKKITVKIKAVKNASGYEIAWSRKKKKGFRSVLVTKNKYVIKKGLKRKKTFYVKVRAYKDVDGKRYYGSYSNPVKVKVK